MNSTHILYGLLILAGLGLVGIFILRLLIKEWNKGIDNEDPADHKDDPFMNRLDDKKSIDNKEEG